MAQRIETTACGHAAGDFVFQCLWCGQLLCENRDCHRDHECGPPVHGKTPDLMSKHIDRCQNKYGSNGISPEALFIQTENGDPADPVCACGGAMELDTIFYDCPCTRTWKCKVCGKLEATQERIGIPIITDQKRLRAASEVRGRTKFATMFDALNFLDDAKDKKE